MSREDLELSDRGFAEYGEGKCTYGADWVVKESSMAGDPRCWLFVSGKFHSGNEKKASLHLSVEQATTLRDQLNRFIQDAEDPDHWKNNPDYIKEWRDGEEEDDEDIVHQKNC